ncbi:MAG TPA: alpha/beta hydrolase [Candidatus Nanopelagicales bacterium]|nr:alpha/beta hydrolase [Candidatus Nanopelagicales bacterium]
MIGHEMFGSGPSRVIVLHDWICDTSTWDGMRPYLDRDRFTWAFTDLRGYGRSMGQRGRFDLTEAAADVIEVADALGWGRFAIVGHSMSTLVALHLAQHAPDRIERAIVLTPPPPSGFGADDATLDRLRAVARGDDAARTRALRVLWGERLSEQWIRFKAARWRACADAEAVAGYVAMFGCDGLHDPTAKTAVPVLAVTGEQDAEAMRRDAVTKLLAPICEALVVTPLVDCGHYPMQETPPLLATIVERFLAGA